MATPHRRDTTHSPSAKPAARAGATPHATQRAPKLPQPTDDDDRDLQDIDGGLSAQPKSNLSGGFDPASERLVPALGGNPTGGDEGVDTAASGMTVVADADAPLDEQQGVREATSHESGAVQPTMDARGALPLPEEPEPTRDDTRGHRPKGTGEMGVDQRALKR